MFVLVIVILLFVVLFLFFKFFFDRLFLRRIIKDSLIIEGAKGHGKTLLLSEISRDCEKKGILSNIDLKRKKQELVKLKDLCCGDNSWEDFLNDEIRPFPKKDDWEGKTALLDDLGVFLPNYADSILKKKYPSLPVFYALSRHLYNMPIIGNCQRYDRPWKLLREQADGFIHCRKVLRFGPFAMILCTYYEKASSLEEKLKPLKARILNKYSKAEVDEYKASNGEIRNFWVFAPTWRNRYDSRFFATKCFSGGTER